MISTAMTPDRPSTAAPDDRPSRRLQPRAAGALERLAACPLSLWLALLAVNAVFLPYRSRFHDALLYGFQVQNAAERGRFHDDLFLRYGSQDSYSIFSMAAAPLARAIGLQPALFLLYLLATALFFLAAMRLARRLIPSRLDAAAGLLLLAVSQPVIGGAESVHLNENFLTARLPAEALVLFGLERLVAGRLAAGLLILLAALTVHPLMAFGGLLVAMAWYTFRYLPRRYLPILAGAGAALAIVGWLLGRAAGVRLLAPVDPFWLTQVNQCSPYMFINEWLPGEWGMLAAAVLIVAWGRRRLAPDPAVTGLLTAVLVVTAMAVAGSVVVWYAPFVLILQGQPFRALWLVQALALLLALPMARDLWSRGIGPWRAVAVLLPWYLAYGSADSLAMGLILVFPVVAVWLRGTDRTPRDPGWLWRSLAAGCVAAVVLDLAGQFTVLSQMRAVLTGLLDPPTLSYLPLAVLRPVFRAGLAMAALAVLACLAGSGRTFRIAALIVFLGVQVSWYRFQDPGPSGTSARLDGEAVRFLRTYLAARGTTADQPPTVYWPTGHVDLLWHDLGVNSYYAWYQLAGNVFRRETAVEGRRRGELVRPFELQLGRRRRLLEPLARPSLLERVFGTGLRGELPCLDDLLRLCDDAGLDYAVLRQGYPGWYAAHHGDWFVYDARSVRVRARARSDGHDPVDTTVTARGR